MWGRICAGQWQSNLFWYKFLILCVFSSCILTGITCSESAVRSDIAGNGMIVYSSGSTTPPFDYRTTASYQWNDGYSLASGDSERTCTGDGTSTNGEWNSAAPYCSRMLFNSLCHMIMYTNSCGLWDSSVYYQWISWDTNNHNIHRDSDLQL